MRIASSTERLSTIGDKARGALLAQHHAIVRSGLLAFQGRIDTAGDGFLTTLDSPAHALSRAASIIKKLAALGLSIRAGVHAGECELVDGKVSGITVHTGARIAAVAAPARLLVSSTIKDLVAGSGLTVEDRGVHSLRGVPGEWHLFAVPLGQPAQHR